jgi:hypothetical protein
MVFINILSGKTTIFNGLTTNDKRRHKMPEETKEESSLKEEDSNDSKIEPTTELKKRDRSPARLTSPKTKRGRPATSTSKNDFLLLIDYTVRAPTSITKVDRTVYYKELHFIRNKDVPNELLPPQYVIRVGSVVAVWQYGNKPFFIKALTNNNGTSATYKMVVSQLIDDELDEEPECPNNYPQNPPDKDFESVNISEIWYLYTRTLDIDPAAHPNHKKQSTANRKKEGKNVV